MQYTKPYELSFVLVLFQPVGTHATNELLRQSFLSNMTYTSIDGFRALQEKLDQPISAPSSPSMMPRSVYAGGVDVASNLVQNIQTLKAEVSRLQSQLRTAQTERK